MESGKNTFLSRSSANSAHAGHRERLRRRALLEGIDDLRPHELLELLLYYAIPRRDVNALAHALDEQFGGVYGVLRADEGALAAVPGLGGRAARWLKRVSALCDAYALLRANPRLFCMAAPMSAEILAREGLGQIAVSGHRRKDFLIFPQGHRLTDLERRWVDRLFAAKNKLAFTN